MKTIACVFVTVGLMITPPKVSGQTLHADFRPRPPEMVVDGEIFSGPLKDILDEAAARLGYQVTWSLVPFPRSLQGLRQGATDIVPRTIKTDERLAYIAYLGPIGYQQKDILFIVRKGQKQLIQDYDDLYSHDVGVKRQTAYFPEFDHDPQITKMETRDDMNLAMMFAGNRFDCIAVLDRSAIEAAFKEIGFSDYTYADYRYQQKIGNYYGMSKKSRHIALYPQLNAVLQQMGDSGRVAEIYTTYGLAPPQQWTERQ